MRCVSSAFLCVAVFASSAGAQTVDKARLRQSIEMPSVATSMSVNFRSHERDGRGNKFDPVQKIAELEKKLTKGPDDAAVYIEQHALYIAVLRDEAKANELLTKAEAVLRPHVNTTDAKLGYLLTYYAAAQESIVANPWAACEAWARRAVSVSPQDWRTWAYLAHARQQLIPTIMFGGDDKHLSKNRRTHETLAALHQRRLNAKDVDEAEKVLGEIMGYHNKARELAPNDPKRQQQRYGFCLANVIIRNGICAFRGQKPAYPLEQFERSVLDELHAAAKLHPDHLLWQSQLANQLVLLGWQLNKDNDGKPGKTFRPARPEDVPVIQEALGRIEKMAVESKGETTVYCRSMLAALCSSMQDHAGAERHSRKILEADPKHQAAADQLQQALLVQDKKTELLTAAQTLAETNRNPRNCYLLAKALVVNQRYDLAENMCLAGIKLDAADIHCVLGLAALTMRKADDRESLKLTNDLLEKARRELRPEAGSHLYIELDYLTSIYQALTGEAAFARVKLERMRADYPESSRFEKALSAIGQ